MPIIVLILALVLSAGLAAAEPVDSLAADVVVYGGTPAGVAGAVAATRAGKTAVLISANRHVGGMTSGGLTATDLGNEAAIGGFTREFYAALGRNTGFSCRAAEAMFRRLLADAGVAVVTEARLSGARMAGSRIDRLEFENGHVASGRMFIDATYEGDLFAAAGCSYRVGREPTAEFDEAHNGVQFRDEQQFVVAVDPYVIPGQPGSGLLAEISAEVTPGRPGAGDAKLQAFNFRMQLSDGPDRVPFPKPVGYDAIRYALLARYIAAADDTPWDFSHPKGPLHLAAGDSNNRGAFSTDFIGGNYRWADGTYEPGTYADRLPVRRGLPIPLPELHRLRESMFRAHLEYQQGLVYFLAHDPAVPQSIHDRMAGWGLDPGEFAASDHWPHQLYVREGRRLVGEHLMTEHECLGRRVAPEPVGLAAYSMDSHNCQRVVVVKDGRAVVRNEGDVQVRCPRPYPIAYRSLTPRREECENLLVPVCLSATHIAYGSIRMEPVFMILGQSAGIAAAVAIEAGGAVQDVAYGALKPRLVDAGVVLTLGGAVSATGQTAAPIGVTPTRMFPIADGSYAPNILRRVGADGSLRTRVTATANAGTARSTPPDADVVIDGSWATSLGWKLTPQECAGFHATFTIDLSEVLLINKVDIYWDRSAPPERWTLAVSRDGTGFEEVATAVVADMAGKNSYEARFAAAEARFIRIEAFGASPIRAAVALGEVRAWLATDAPPPTIHDGYSLAFLQGVRRAARPSAEAWKAFSNITTGHPNLGNLANPATKQDVSYEVDLAAPAELSGVKVVFDSPEAAWEHGGRIEVATDPQGPWTAAVEVERMTTGFYPIDAKVGPVRLVRFTNRAHPERGPGQARLVLVEIFAPVRESAITPLARVPTRAGQHVSAGVFDSQGVLVGTLAMSAAGNGNPVPLYWDGRDDLGRSVPAGRYEWRAIVNTPQVATLGGVGDSGTPPFGPAEALGGVHMVEYDGAGNLYYGVWFMERDGLTIRKLSPAGGTLWEASLNGAIALAADEREVYVSRSPIMADGEDRIYRFDAATGAPLPYPDGRAYLTVNGGRPQKVETLTRTLHDRMTLEPLGGLTLDSTRLYASNYIENRVEVFERESGRRLGEIPVPRPIGLALRSTPGNWKLWIASGDETKCFSSPDGLAFQPHAGLAIRGGPAPQALSLNSTGDELAVADVADGTVRVYRIAADGRATRRRQVGRKAEPGILGADTFRPSTRWDVALHDSGTLAVGDAGNRMLRVFDKNGDLVRSEFSEFQPAPEPFAIQPDSHRLLSGPWEYEVNLGGTPEPGPLWYRDGTWRVAANWTPDDALFCGGLSQRVRLRNGEDYLVFLGHHSSGLAFYHLRDGRMRRSVIVGNRWTGLDESIRSGARGALWTWRDLDGNGRIDWENPDPEKVGRDQEGEIIVPLRSSSGWQLMGPGVTVDEQGTIWVAGIRDQVAKFPLQGFDEHANPIYDFADPRIVVPSTVKQDGFRANNLRIGRDGAIYALGFSTAAPSTNQWLWMGGREIRRYDAEGELRSRFTVPNAATIVSFVNDPLDPEILYTASNHGSTWQVRVWSKDGLCLSTITPDVDRVGKPGWIDHFMGMNVFTPDGKQRLFYGEDVYHGKAVLFRLGDWAPATSLSGAVVLEQDAAAAGREGVMGRK